MRPWAFLTLALCLPVSVTAFFGASNDTSFWDDFANNFGTDLAPIISLFGEQVTKQFLSELTTPLDIIIFAAGPLGILTAIVSCIRVCGGSFLKSLVGRAREPHTLSEIEVCSSTSENVCELWSNGGICRVFGRPHLLEFLFRNPSDSKEFYRGSYEFGEEFPVTCGIVLPSQLFGSMYEESFVRNKSESDLSRVTKTWKEIPPHEIIWLPRRIRTILGYFSRRTDATNIDSESHDSFHRARRDTNEEGPSDFAPYPNLALNLGVQDASTSVSRLWMAAIFGVLLQASFFGYATWASWYHPNFYQEQASSNTTLFFIFTIAGTASVVAGMALSAKLIDRNSKERLFVLEPANPNQLQPDNSNQLDHCNADQPYERIFWLQPAQRIGDQQFDVFAYNEVKKEYITSWKVHDNSPVDGNKQEHTVQVWLAVGLSFLGWVLQFIGLRGQHATISLYQLCCTIAMSILRALIRSFRSPPKNQLGQVKNKVNEHELDWQTLSLAEYIDKEKSDKTTCWAIGGDPRAPSIGIMFQRKEEDTVDMIRWTEATDKNRDVLPLSSEGASMDEILYETRMDRVGEPTLGAKLMRIRLRLASLQTWDTEIRRTALKLRGALQEAAELIVPPGILSDPEYGAGAIPTIIWSTSCQVWTADPGSSRRTDIICFRIHRVRDNWTIDGNQLEAVLGLWFWTLKSQLQEYELEVIRAKVVSKGSKDIAPLLEHWGLRISPGRREYGDISNLSIPNNFSSLHREAPNASQPTRVLHLFSSRSELLELMAQDIFTTFIESLGQRLQPDQLIDMLISKRQVTREKEGSVVDRLAGCLVSKGLATRDEAIMSIVSGFFPSSKFPTKGSIQRTLIYCVGTFKRERNFKVAKNIATSLTNASTLLSDAPVRSIKSWCETYRSEIRRAVEKGLDSTQKAHMLERWETETKGYQAEHQQLITVYDNVIKWLLDSNPGPILEEVLRNDGPTGILDETTLNGLDTIQSWEVAHQVGLKLNGRFDFSTLGIVVRKRLLRWAIEWDCTGLVEDLWGAENPDHGNAKSVFSHGSHELFWAVNCKTAEKDMMNTIWFLLDVVERDKDEPLQLYREKNKQYWATSRQKDGMETKYKQFDTVLLAAAANPDGFEAVRALMEGGISSTDLSRCLVAAIEYGSLDSVKCFLDEVNEERTDLQHLAEPLRIAAKWGLLDYVRKLVYQVQRHEDERFDLLRVQKALEEAQNPLSDEEEQRARKLMDSDKWGVVMYLTEALQRTRPLSGSQVSR
ncbi:hypothetical protein BKA56DRAFT_672441 [Ilyonectria sp. MPI-CAGE-AT-0026]|nr:hypothetical protein BKA56DRAFT_672441 [Ilyonectria sp. MPI-CAGE-AT-0026]